MFVYIPLNNVYLLFFSTHYICPCILCTFNFQTGCMYVHGGVTELDVERTSAVRAILLDLPSLRELSWHVVVTSISRPERIPQRHLLELGVPNDLLARLS